MIELINVSKYYPTRFGRHYIFQNVSLKLPADVNIGIVGANGAGKSTLMRLLAGVDYPSEGRVVRLGKISWPLGLVPSMLGPLTGRENARFVCRIYGLSAREIEQKLVKIAEVADIGNYFDMPVRTYSSGMKSRLNFATSMAIEFDYYLFDEIGAPGDRFFRQTSKRMMEERLAKSRFIMTSHNAQDLLDLCDTAILLRNGSLSYFDDVRDALREYGEEVDGEAAQRRQRRRGARSAVADEAAPVLAETSLPPETKREPAPVRPVRKPRSRPRPVKPAAAPVISSGGEGATPVPATTPPPAAPLPTAAASSADNRRAPSRAPAAKTKPPRGAVPLRRPAKMDGPQSQ